LEEIVEQKLPADTDLNQSIPFIELVHLSSPAQSTTQTASAPNPQHYSILS